MRGRIALSLLALGTLGAVALGTGLVRAGLVTDYVGVEPDYLLNGPSDPTCDVPFDIDRQITVTWVDGDDAESGFIVTRQGPLVNGTSTAQFQLPASSGSGGTVTFTDTSVVPDDSYTYTIRSFLGPALSPAASVSEGCTTQSVPAAPTEVVAEGTGEHSIRISWVSNSSNEEGFRLYRFSTDSRIGVETVLLAPAGASSYDDNGLELGAPGLLSRTEYGYYVEAYNGRGPTTSTPPVGTLLATATTWSIQPRVENLEVGEGIRPTFTWEFEDDDPPANSDPQQTAVEVQVCAVEFGESGCPVESWRWSTGQQPFTGQSIEYLHAYPWGGALHEHPLDFSASQRYYVRVRAWDDTGTPSEWATPASSSFTVEPPSGAIVNSIDSSVGLTLPGGATFSASYGGEVVLVGGGSSVVGALPNLNEVVSARLLGSTAPNLTWEVKRTNDAGWTVVGGDGTNPAVWPAASNGLEWRVSRPGGAGQAVVGGVALLVNANHAPTVIQCRAAQLIGGVDAEGNGGSGEEFDFTVSVSDVDSDFSYALTEVQFDWDGGTGPSGWQDFVPPSPLTVFTASWPVQGNFTPTVQVRDQYGATSPVTPCDTVLVGSATPAWLQTRDADVFSGGTIFGRSPEGQHNATYLVQATGEIQEFTTEARNCRRDIEGAACDTGEVRTSNYRQIPLPQPNGGQPLGTVLGSVDLGAEDPIDPENGTDGTGILGERYGNVTRYTGSNTNLSTFFATLSGSPLAPSAKVLNGAIVHVLGNATVDATTTIGNAGDGQSGAGLIVVDGDLFINAPITYDVNPVQTSLRRLASLGWLVKGNVYVSPSVWAVDPSSPAFACPGIGQFADCRPGVVGTFYLYDSRTGRGIFFTGTGGTLDDYPLQLGGLVVAQRFALQRNRPDELVPAELFSYDGRVFANPPPGLQDFAKALPRWRPLAPLP